ncbi:hypothetical protein PAXINDRAFT_14129 [Paxillus involutus ATCC 200175]|uniref:Uncharacterized protein n=1 Tax=Paxillus involutus ATCC 200175 TaxID=664439 RepID=A0A0C9U0P1_PAXIN|nr:hypothetical protein PAXINDRAFT_14129 [Paxillus involutus ATCC 200175]
MNLRGVQLKDYAEAKLVHPSPSRTLQGSMLTPRSDYEGMSCRYPLPALFFSITQKLGELRPELLKESRPLQLSVLLMGITGDFTLRASPNALAPKIPYPSRKLLWAAGGISLTPFLAMLAGLRGTADGENEVGAQVYDIISVLSTREPEVPLPLVMRAARCRDDDARASSLGTMTIHLFSRSPPLSSTLPTAGPQLGLMVDVKRHTGRLRQDTLRRLEFEGVVLGALNEVEGWDQFQSCRVIVSRDGRL